MKATAKWLGWATLQGGPLVLILAMLDLSAWQDTAIIFAACWWSIWSDVETRMRDEQIAGTEVRV